MSNLLDDVGISNSQLGSGLGAAGDLVGGISQFMAGTSGADRLKAAAKRVDNATQIRLVQERRQAYMFQGHTQAAIGGNMSALGGSAADILRMNASNLALDAGIIQAQGSEESAALRSRASASLASGWGGLIKGVVEAAGVIAAPFTGGASLAVTAAAAAS